MGKGNIAIEPSQGEVAATFRMGQKRLTFRLKEAYLEQMERELDGKPEKAVIDYAFGIMDTAPDKMLEVS